MPSSCIKISLTSPRLGFLFLEREFKPVVTVKFNSRYFTSFLFGAAFAAGWTPCVGVVPGSILGLVATQPGLAPHLLFSYSIGLGLPFLMVDIFASQASNFIQKYAVQLSYATKIFGAVIIILGVLAFTQNLNRIANLEILNRILLK